MTEPAVAPVSPLAARRGWFDPALAWAPVDGASLAAVRVLFGALMCFGAVRFWAQGWIERFYVRPSFHFHYLGFAWVQPWPAWGMYAHYAVIALSALSVALGFHYRIATLVLFLSFTYAELIDVTFYLNHYYLVSLVALLMCVMPLHRTFSLDAWRRPALATGTVPAWCVWLLRLQVGVVYAFAAIAKLQGDWLLHAQPLSIWLRARAELPWLGPLFAAPWAPFALSWAGFLHDALVVPLLLSRKTRPYAYALLVGFHLTTGALFQIGMFPPIMIALATVFFAPSWPRRLFGSRGPAPVIAPPRLTFGRRAALAALVLYASCQVLVPMRAWFYPGNVLWHEQGMRFAWKVMVREKQGAVSYRVRIDGAAREMRVPPSRYLTREQEREMSAQPDLVLQLAHHIARDFRARGARRVEVRADTFASLNARPASRLVDPTADLARVGDGVGRADWITDAPAGAPPSLGALARR